MGLDVAECLRWEALSRAEKRELLSGLAHPERALDLIKDLSAACPDAFAQYDVASNCAFVPFISDGHAETRTVASYYHTVSGGGIESAMVALAESLSAGCESLVLTDEVLFEKRGAGDAGLHRVDALAGFLRANHVDVLVHHAWFGPDTLWDVLVCRALGVKVVLNTHGAFSHFLCVTDGTCASWNDGRLFALVPKIAALCDAVVCETAVNRRFFAEFSPRAYEIPNVLSKKAIEALSRQTSMPRCCAESRTVLWVGRFDIFKRPEDAIDIFSLVHEAVPDARLVLVGESGYESYERELLARAEDLGLKEFVSLEGFQDPFPYYEEAAVLLLTTEIEGYCMVLAEACSCGLPTVAYELPYLPFASNDGVAWVGQGDKRAAARELSDILLDSDRWGAMRRANLEFAENGFGSSSASAWSALLDDLSAGSEGLSGESECGDRIVWDTLIGHYLTGAERTRKEVSRLRNEASDARAECEALRERASLSLAACRDEYEASVSYRLGRALTSVPRFVRSLVHGER